MTAQKLQFQIRNLTGTTTAGKTFQRRAEVLCQLEELSEINFTVLQKRILISDEKAENSLKSETMVFLFRELFQKQGFDEIYETLSGRILQIIGRYRSKVKDFKEFSQNVQLEFLKKVLDFESDKGDYAQVSFGEFIVGLALNEFRNYITKDNREYVTDSIDEDFGEEDKTPKFNFESRNISPEDQTFVNQALKKLPANLREAFILYHFYNYKIRSKKEIEPTLTEHFQKSDKTIRNWLNEAEEILAGLR